MKIIFGLGNPGRQYVATRHNIGFAVLDRLGQQGSVSWRADEDAQSLVGRFHCGTLSALLVKPQTYMNRSGKAVVRLCDRLECGARDIAVVLDDAAMDFGRLRLRSSGGDGGHNGLASIIEEVGSQEIARLRLGIGPRPAAADLIDYVLGEFAPEEDVEAATQRASEALRILLADGIDAAMNTFNG